MTKVTLDDSIVSKIADLTEYTEFCDRSGKTVGYFLPAGGQTTDPYKGISSPFSDEELERRKREETWSTLAEIWQRLDPK